MQRLTRECRRLDDPAITTQIFQGLITSADHIYHLKRIGPGVYESRADRENTLRVQIEDAVMRPLVSGSEVDRYVKMKTDTYLLFPYELSERGAALIAPLQFEREFPLAWTYLLRHEAILRNRENGKMNLDDRWWGYVYPKNLDKHQLPKLAVPRLLLKLFCALDIAGEFSLDNVDVGGLIFRTTTDLLFVAAVLNAPVANFVWRRLSKPFQNDYRSANKQFIAPLPIPNASDEEKQEIGRMALGLQALHTQSRHLEHEVERRLEICEPDRRTEDWVLPAVGSMEEWKRRVPGDLRGRDRTAWVKEQRARQLTAELAQLQSRIEAPENLQAHLANGELSIEANGFTIIDHVFVTPDEGPFIRVQWQLALWGLNQTPSLLASRVVDALRTLRHSDNDALKQQVINFADQVADTRVRLTAAEGEMNERLYALYRITPEERALLQERALV